MGERAGLGGGGVVKGGGPPSRVDLDLAHDQNTAQKDSWVLATIDSWVSAGRPKEDVVAKIMVSFSLEDLREAASTLRKGDWCVPKVSVTQEGNGGADYSRMLAEKVYTGLVSIQNQVPLKVHFWVSAHDLAKAQKVGPFVDQLDEPGVAARLGSVDAQLLKVLDRLGAAENLSATVEGLAKTVDALQKQVNEQQQGTTVSWASVAGTGRQGRVTSLKTVEVGVEERSSQRQRLISNEVERGLRARNTHPAPSGSALSQDLAELAARGSQQPQSDEFTEVQRRKRKGSSVLKGSSSIHAEGGVKPPFSVFVSRTSPSTTEEIVKDKLMQCQEAMTLEEGETRGKLDILSVVPIKLKIPDGEEARSKCWKVTVAPECAPHMAKAEAYPTNWGWRKWNYGPRVATQAQAQERNTTDGGA